MRQFSSTTSLSNIAKLAWWAGAIALVYQVHGIYTGSPIVPRWMAVNALAAGCLIWFARHVILRRTVNVTLSEAIITALLTWSAITLTWSLDWRDGLLTIESALALAVIYAAFRRFKEREQRQIISIVSVTGFALALAFGWSRQELYGGFGNENFQAEWLLITLPFLIWTWVSNRHHFFIMRAAALLLTPVALYFLLFVNLSDSKWAALGCVLLLVSIWIYRNKGFIWAGIVFMVPVNIALFSGWFASPPVQKAFMHRLEIGFNTALMWWEKPWFGHGVGSFNYEYGRFQEAHLAFFPNMDTVLRPAAIFAGAAHNEFLQLASETGVIGLAAALALVSLILLTSWDKRRDSLSAAAPSGTENNGLRNAAIYSVVIALGLSTVGFPFQNPASMMTVVLAIAILMQNEKNLFSIVIASIKKPRLVPQFTVISSVVAAFVFVYSAGWSWRAEALYALTRHYIEQGIPIALAANIEAHSVYPYEARYRRQLMMTVVALMKQAHGRVEIQPAAADEAYRVSLTAAGRMPAVKMVRLEYLLNSENWSEYKKEIEDTLGFLRRYAKLQPGVWVAEGMYGLFVNDAQRALIAVARGKSLPMSGAHQEQFNYILSQLNIEPEKT